MSKSLVPLRKRTAQDPAAGVIDATRPLGVYVHFPFCTVRCPYCDFAVDVRPEIPHEAFADAIVAELAARRSWFLAARGAAPRLVSIYFGGGTPGLWRPAAVGRVIEAARRAFDGPPVTTLEITLEANPGEVDQGHLVGLRGQGVNRLSLGAQAFDDDLLRRIGRNHDLASIPRAVAAARAAGFEALSCDVIYGLPGQTHDGWLRGLEALIALAPEHISAYGLTVERGTAFGALERKRQLERPDDEASAAMFAAGRAALAAAGYEHYEVSSHARPGHRAMHNHLYWTGGSYLGVGPSASSFRPLEGGTGLRFTNPRATTTYLRAAASGHGSPMPALVERRSATELENEAVWLGLRTADGIDRSAHAARYGADPLALPGRADAAAGCEARGWLAIDEASLRLTPAGFLFADEVAARMWA